MSDDNETETPKSDAPVLELMPDVPAEPMADKIARMLPYIGLGCLVLITAIYLYQAYKTNSLPVANG